MLLVRFRYASRAFGVVLYPGISCACSFVSRCFLLIFYTLSGCLPLQAHNDFFISGSNHRLQIVGLE